MSDEGKFDWRLRSQVRGLRLLIFSLPLLLIGLVASSQLPRTTTKVLWESQASSSMKQRAVITLPADGREQSPVQLLTTFTAKSSRLRAAMRYEIWDDQKDLITRRTLRFGPRAQADGSRVYRSAVINLDTNRKYLIRSQLNIHKADLRHFSNWQWQVLQDPDKPSKRLLQMIELLSYPALSLTILGLVMVFGPRLVK
ncbi:MAG: hypothetical protein ACOH5I_17685 [Oligoflexus sp.]